MFALNSAQAGSSTTSCSTTGIPIFNVLFYADVLLLLVASASHYYALDESMETSIEESSVLLPYDDSLVAVAYVIRVYAGVQCGACYAPFCWFDDGEQHILLSLCKCHGISVVMPDHCSAGSICNPHR